jgi:amino acid permease
MFMSMIATAYMAHYNAPKFMTELKERTVSNYNKVTSAAFGFAILMYTFVLVIGFLTFGGNAQGFILNNYASTDSLATVARIAIGGGVLFGYPLTFTALRDGFLDIAGLDTNKYFVPATVGLLAIITQMSLVVTDVGSVLSFSGALIGSLLIFIIPAIMNICNIKREQKVAAEKGGESAKGSNTVVVLNYAMAVFGVMVAVIGVGANIAAGGKGGGH